MKNKFMTRAIELSIESVNLGGGPFGSIIVKNDKVIAEGSNKVTLNNDPTAHGEIVAIRKACKSLNNFNLSGCELYSTCEPCPMCLGAIYWARPDAIYFGNSKEDAAEINFDDNFIYDELDISLNERKLPTIQLLRAEAQSAFIQWQKCEDKIEY